MALPNDAPRPRTIRPNSVLGADFHHARSASTPRTRARLERAATLAKLHADGGHDSPGSHRERRNRSDRMAADPEKQLRPHRRLADLRQSVIVAHPPSDRRCRFVRATQGDLCRMDPTTRSSGASPEHSAGVDPADTRRWGCATVRFDVRACDASRSFVRRTTGAPRTHISASTIIGLEARHPARPRAPQAHADTRFPPGEACAPSGSMRGRSANPKGKT